VGWTTKESRIPNKAKRFSLLYTVHIGSGAHPASITGSRSAGSWSWTLNSLYAEVKNSWSCTFPPSYVFMTCFIKNRDNFHFSSSKSHTKILCLLRPLLYITLHNIVTYTHITRQRFVKYFAETYARSNREAVFSVGSMPKDNKGTKKAVWFICCRELRPGLETTVEGDWEEKARNKLNRANKTSCVISSYSVTVINPLPGYD
jgi:hypothetical protein